MKPIKCLFCPECRRVELPADAMEGGLCPICRIPMKEAGVVPEFTVPECTVPGLEQLSLIPESMKREVHINTDYLRQDSLNVEREMFDASARKTIAESISENAKEYERAMTEIRKISSGDKPDIRIRVDLTISKEGAPDYLLKGGFSQIISDRLLREIRYPELIADRLIKGFQGEIAPRVTQFVQDYDA